MHAGAVLFSQQGRLIAKGRRNGNLFELAEFAGVARPLEKDENISAFVSSTTPSFAILHARLGHPSMTTYKTVTQHVEDLPDALPDAHNCDSCIIGKAKRPPLYAANFGLMDRAELVHWDVQSPFRIPGPKSEKLHRFVH